MTREVEDDEATAAPSPLASAPRARPARRPWTRVLRTGLLAIVVVAAVVVATRMVTAPVPEVATPAMAPPKVMVAAPLRQRLTTWTSFTGQFSAIDRVEIRAQVSGYLTEIHFTDGQLVKQGDLLFVIDPRPYDIALQNARAQVATAEAALKLSGQQLERTSNLVTSSFASRETLDQRTEQRLAADAALDQAKAAVRKAELDMGWTRIIAPISGRIGRHLVSTGNLVAGGQGGGATTMLTTIVSQDPIYLDFDMGESDYVAYQRFLHRPHDGHAIDRSVDVELSDESGWKHHGALDFLDNEMDRSSGTLHARATVPNHDLLIAAGQFARLRVPTAAPADTLLVPEAAISTDQSRTLVMTVAPDGTVVPKVVEIGEPVGELRIVKSGLKPDDRVIVDGLMFARPGGKVTPQSSTIAPAPDQG